MTEDFTMTEAQRYLDEHASYQLTGRIDSPSTQVIEEFCAAMGDPQHCAPVIHVTGTNGKGSTVQMISRMLEAAGLTVGTYTSPHLERVNERIRRNGEPISDEEFADVVGAARAGALLAPLVLPALLRLLALAPLVVRRLRKQQTHPGVVLKKHV